MNIALITTVRSAPELDRILDEAHKMGHNLEILNAYDGVTDDITARLEHSDLIIVRGIFKNTKQIATLLEKLKKTHKVFDNNFSFHKYSINKSKDIQKLMSADIKMPKTWFFDTWDSVLNHEKSFTYPLVAKAVRTGKGMNIYKLENGDELRKFVDEKLQIASAQSYLFQEYIKYTHDLRVLVIGDKFFTMKRIPPAGDFRANFSIGGSVEPFKIDEDIKKLATKACEAVGLEIAGVDILITESGEKFILEVNHTPGFLGMEKALSINIAFEYLSHILSKNK